MSDVAGVVAVAARYAPRVPPVATVRIAVVVTDPAATGWLNVTVTVSPAFSVPKVPVLANAADIT